MVQMNSETTVIGGASRMSQPSVNYQPTVRQPVDNRLRMPMKEEGTDWGEAIASSIDSIARAYGEGQKLQAKQKADDAKAQAESNKRGLLNQLAQEVGVVVEEQRQGVITPTAAETRIRGIQMNFLTSHGGTLTEKEISDTTGRFAFGLDTIEESRVAKRMGFEEDYRNDQIAEFQTNNKGLQHLSRPQAGAMMDEMNRGVDNIGKINATLSKLTPGSQEWQLAKSARDEYLNKNTYLNVMNFVGNSLADNQEITPSVIQNTKIAGRGFAQRLGISEAEYGAAFDMAVQRLGYSGRAADNMASLKLSTDEQQAAITGLQTNTKYQAHLSVPGYTAMSTIGGRAFEEIFANSVYNRDPDYVYNMANKLMSNEKNDEGQQAIVAELPSQAIAPMINGTRAAMSRGSSSPYTRGVMTTTSLELFNKYNAVSPDMSPEQLNTIVLNTDRTRGLLNTEVLKQQEGRLIASEDPELQQLGYEAKAAREVMDANSIAARIMTSGSSASPAFKALRDSFVTRGLRYNEAGEVLLSDADTGLLGGLGKTFGSIDYSKNIDTLNKTLSRLDEGTRLQVVQKLGFKPLGNEEDMSIAQAVGDFHRKFASVYNPSVSDFIKAHQQEFDEFLLGSGEKEQSWTMSKENLLGGEERDKPSDDAMELLETLDKPQAPVTDAEHLRQAADRLEASTAQLSPAAMKEYGKGNKEAIARARAKADELDMKSSASTHTSIPLANASIVMDDIDGENERLAQESTNEYNKNVGKVFGKISQLQRLADSSRRYESDSKEFNDTMSKAAKLRDKLLKEYPEFSDLINVAADPFYEDNGDEEENIVPDVEGNIDIDNRKVVHNPDGSISTERSITIEVDGYNVLIPTVVNGKVVSEDEAIAHFKKTGKHLGMFKDPLEAEIYADRLHNRQGKKYGKNN